MTPASEADRLHTWSRQLLCEWAPAMRAFLVPVALFALGYAVGTIAGSVIERGVGLTFSRIAPAPVFSAMRLLAWGIAFMLASCIWRVPRRYLIGHHRLGSMPMFLASCSMAFASYLSLVLLEQFEFGRGIADSLFILAFIVPAIAAVELEIFLVRWFER